MLLGLILFIYNTKGRQKYLKKKKKVSYKSLLKWTVGVPSKISCHAALATESNVTPFFKKLQHKKKNRKKVNKSFVSIYQASN